MEHAGSAVDREPLAVWRRQADQESFDAAVKGELAALALVDRRGRLDVEVESSLAVLCRPRTEFYGWIQRGDTISFVQSESVAAVDGRQTSEVGARTMAASREVLLAQRIASKPTTGGGQLSVARRDTMGRRKASEHPLRYADTASGRWLNLTASLPNGDNQILLAPATTADLAARLREMYDAL